jgi:pimeloyl-ACP methyl ester carboxylesterase
VSTNTNHTTAIPYDAIDAELLCLWVKNDVMQPIDYGRQLAEVIGGEVVALDKSFHWVPEDRTEAYRAELRAFLDQ